MKVLWLKHPPGILDCNQINFPVHQIKLFPLIKLFISFSVVVWVAGLVAAIGVAILGVFCFLSVLQLAMLSSKEKVVLKYSVCVITKVALGLLAGEINFISVPLYDFGVSPSNIAIFFAYITISSFPPSSSFISNFLKRLRTF